MGDGLFFRPLPPRLSFQIRIFWSLRRVEVEEEGEKAPAEWRSWGAPPGSMLPKAARLAESRAQTSGPVSRLKRSREACGILPFCDPEETILASSLSDLFSRGLVVQASSRWAGTGGGGCGKGWSEGL